MAAGEVDPAAKKLCEVTQEALLEAIKKCAPGVPYNAIGKTIQVRRPRSGRWGLEGHIWRRARVGLRGVGWQVSAERSASKGGGGEREHQVQRWAVEPAVGGAAVSVSARACFCGVLLQDARAVHCQRLDSLPLLALTLPLCLALTLLCFPPRLQLAPLPVPRYFGLI